MTNPLAKSGQVSKFIVALMSAASTDMTIYFGGSHWVPMATAALGAIGVYLVPNSNSQPPAAA